MVSLTETASNGIQPGPKDAPAGCDATKAKQRHILDIVFLQDATGSQGPYIQACRAAITNICNKVSEHMGSPTSEPQSSSSSSSPSELDPIRFGLIAFRDHPPQDTSYVTKNFGFTSSVGEMKKWLGGLVASGGGDGPEASTAALADALNMEWRQSEDDQVGDGKKGVKVVKIVVLVTDAPPHGLGEAGDGFPNGSPDQNDPLDIARQMAEHGISLYVIACEPSLTHYQHAVDFYRALTQITSGRMVPLLNASQLGDYILGSALETLETEELLSQFQDIILEDVYRQGKSIEEVVQGVQQQLQQQQVQMQTLQVDDIYTPSKDAEANVASWMKAGKLGDARSQVQQSPSYEIVVYGLGVPGVFWSSRIKHEGWCNWKGYFRWSRTWRRNAGVDAS
ncbi:elongation factor-2 kinase [Coprinopsis sp. MPI-PUGE-AT-0042]|nr:elongation factor-2 kinase [Coprinopsis sp. MPI-PUGE-AT-0042]